MVNFGYPYNDLVICKDSTNYLSVCQDILHQILPGEFHCLNCKMPDSTSAKLEKLPSTTTLYLAMRSPEITILMSS